MIPPCGGPFAGMAQPALAAALAQAQQSLINLTAGALNATVSYSMSGEVRSVTYTRANQADLRLLIQDLQRALGLIPQRRGFRFSY